MTDVQLDFLVASVSPVSDGRVAALALADTEAELLEAILTIPRDEPVRLAGTAGERGRPARADVLSMPDRRPVRHRPRRLAAAVAVAAALLVGALAWPQRGVDDPADVVSASTSVPTSTSTTTTSAPRPVELVPGPWSKYVVDLPGWALTRIRVWEGDGRYSANFTYSDGNREVWVVWGQGPGAQPYHQDYDMYPPIEVLGHQAWLWQSKEEKDATELHLPDPAGTDAFEAAWANGQRDFVQVRGRFPTVESFLEVVHAIRPVDDATFSAARPADYIVPKDQPAVIDEVLTDIPRPAGFDADEMIEPNGGVGVERPRLVDPVVQEVTCGWVEAWVVASDRGDADGARQAADAMTRLVAWPALHEMQAWRRDYYRAMVAEFADAMSTGRMVTLDRHTDEPSADNPVPVDEAVPSEPVPIRDVWSRRLRCY